VFEPCKDASGGLTPAVFTVVMEVCVFRG